MRKETYQKADMGFQILISVAVICNLAAKAIWGRPPVIVPLAGLVALLISAIGLFICRHETFGVVHPGGEPEPLGTPGGSGGGSAPPCWYDDRMLPDLFVRW